MDELLQYLQSLHPLSPELQAALIPRFTKETYRKNKTVLAAGQVCDWIFFLEKGLVKTCYDIPGGNERIISFQKAGESVCAVKSFTSSQPSRLSIISMDETVIRKIRKVELEAICEKHPLFNNHLRKIIGTQSALIEDHYMLLTLRSRERFAQVEEAQGWIAKDKRIKDYMMADYLGIDKATFSRLRNLKQRTYPKSHIKSLHF